MSNNYRGPLAGLNIIDFGHYYAGPMAAMLLADQGATVIHVQKPSQTGERELPETQFRLLNRNKKLLTLDLKTEQGKTQALSLIEKADVVIENFRPGVMGRLGLDYANVKATNPGLVYLSLPGFSATDQARASIQAWEGILSAACGVFDPREPYLKLGFPPVFDPVPICSAAGGMQGAIAVMAALIARRDSGMGTLIETPLLDAGLSVYSNFFPMVSVAGVMTRKKQLADSLKKFQYSPDKDLASQLNEVREVLVAAEPLKCFYYKYFKDAKGRSMLFWLWQRPAQVERFLKALGIDRQLQQEGFVNLGPWEAEADNNMSGNFHTAWGQMSPERTERIIEVISQVLATKTVEEWEVIMAEAKVPFGVVRTQEEWLALEPMLKCGVNMRMDNGESVLTVPGRMVDVDGPGGALIQGYEEAQVISESDAEALLQKIAVSHKKEPGDSPNKGDLLKGLKVLDLCNIVAGPTSTSTLAQFGAEVIKAEAVHELPSIIDFMLDQNQGKRSIINDVKTAPGREVFERLVRWADVVAHNVLDDTAKRLGITQEQLRKINPKVVSCQVNTFGGSYRGGWENRPGYDQIAKVVTGMKTRFGTIENPDGPPSEWIIADIMGGLCLAYSSLLAVWQQRETGYAGEGRTSLVRGNNYIYLPHMIAENGRSRWGQGHTRLDVGESWWQRLYRCQDEWIYVGAHQDKASALVEAVLGKAESENGVAQKLEGAFATQTSAHWQSLLQSRDIACHSVVTLSDLLENADIRQVGNEAENEEVAGGPQLLCQPDHPCGKPITFIAPTWARIGSQGSYKRLTPAPRLGADTREILSELGYSEEDTDELIRLKVVHEFLPGMGSKTPYFYEPDKS